jgi:hypothetical protein
LRIKYTINLSSQRMETIKSIELNRLWPHGRYRDRERYHPIAEGVNTTDKWKIGRHPTVFGGRHPVVPGGRSAGTADD